MGQYFVICNLDKREFLTPSDFGHGSKLGEIGLSGGGALAGLCLLLALSGSSWYTGTPIHGRWAGDRIAIMGDYYQGTVGGIAWSEDYDAMVAAQDDGWVDISAHVIAVLNDDWELALPHPSGASRSMLHSDGTITTSPSSSSDDHESANLNLGPS